MRLARFRGLLLLVLMLKIGVVRVIADLIKLVLVLWISHVESQFTLKLTLLNIVPILDILLKKRRILNLINRKSLFAIRYQQLPYQLLSVFRQ